MWTKGNYRRIFLDMHIDDSKEEYLSRLEPERILKTLKDAGAQMIVVKSRPHTGLALFPTKYGRMHRGLKGRDYVGEMIELCHKNGIAVQAYFSQIFDNWAYENHPEWRMINGEGKNSREECDYYSETMFRKGRYGLVCPNNEEYRQYAKDCLTEMTEKYQFESIFMDMPFWPEVCYCPSCRKKYYEATGREMPRVINWDDPAFKEWQLLREKWMGEFTEFTSGCVKAVRPEVTIQQNLSVMVSPWVYASTEYVADVCDYAGGDLYGGYLEESFMCKYYRNITKSLPFEFITSRCDPGLTYHTTTKSEEELLLYTMTALLHDGALSICDGMNPDGTIAESVYNTIIKDVFGESQKYERYVGGKLVTDAALWYPLHSKCSWNENGKPITDREYHNDYIETLLNMARILRQEHILFDVISSRQLATMEQKVLIISDAVNVQDDEIRDIENFVKNGGTLYISGHLGHPRFYELLEAQDMGRTAHNVTYMAPSEEGKAYFVGFDKVSPLNIQGQMEQLRFTGEYKTLATITLPYTMTETQDFSSIHSNPPGVHTDIPAVVEKAVGAGRIIWTAAPIENAKPYMSRQAVGRLVSSLVKERSAYLTAPACVELIEYVKDEKRYFGILNEQEQAPFIGIDDISITVPYPLNKAICLDTGEELSLCIHEGSTIIKVPKLKVFHLIEAE